MYPNVIQRLLVCSAALALSACASIVSDNDTSTYIETDPKVATCDLEGKDFKHSMQTPDRVILPANAAPISVTCTADGYKPSSDQLDTELDGWIFGNIIVGGVIGAAVDLVRGAGFKYPPSFHVFLQPEKFKTGADRDAWFDRRRKFINDKWDDVVKKIKGQCGTGTCEDEQNRANKKRQEELDKLESLKQTVVVEIPSA